MMRRRLFPLLSFVLALALLCCGCGGTNGTSEGISEPPAETTPGTEAAASEAQEAQEPVTLLLAAAASLEYAFKDDLIPMFEAECTWITVEGTYDSSGKLQTQIEEGLAADVFFSAANKQMNALKEQNLIDESSVIELLENKIVLITAVDSDTTVTGFEDIVNAESIAVGDPESVPVGQYAKEALESLGVWADVEAAASFGTNVTEVLNWVAEGSAQVGIVYATDAATTDKVQIIGEAPEGSLATKVLYPVGILSDSAHGDAAALFLEFLKSEPALAVFEAYGFSVNQA